MEAVAVVVDGISTRKLNSNLAFLLTLCISIPFVVQTPDFEKMLLKSRQRITQDMKVAGVLIREISTRKLKSNLAFVLTLSISIQSFIQTPDSEKISPDSRQRIIHDLEAVAEVCSRYINP